MYFTEPLGAPVHRAVRTYGDLHYSDASTESVSFAYPKSSATETALTLLGIVAATAGFAYVMSMIGGSNAKTDALQAADKLRALEIYPR